jgi:hypothetical protein
VDVVPIVNMVSIANALAIAFITLTALAEKERKGDIWQTVGVVQIVNVVPIAKPHMISIAIQHAHAGTDLHLFKFTVEPPHCSLAD